MIFHDISDRFVTACAMPPQVILAHLKVVMKFREMQQNGQLSNEHKVFITNNQDLSKL